VDVLLSGVLALSILHVLPLAAAEPPAADVTLGDAVPSDAVFYLHWRLEPEGGLARKLEGLRSALASSGFLEAARERWVEAVEKQEPAGGRAGRASRKRRFEEETVRWRQVLEAVPWWKLASREGVIALRREGEDLQALAVFRVDPKEREEVVGALRQVLYAFCSTSTRFEMTRSVRDGESIDVLYRIAVDDDAESGGTRPLAGLVDALLGGARRERHLSLSGKGSVVSIATSANLLGRSLQLLEGRGSDIGFGLTARREEGLTRLGAPPPSSAASFEVHARPSDLLKGLDVLGAFESFVAAGGSDGDSLAYAYRADLPAAGGSEADAARKALEGAGIAGMLRAVPKDATWFRVGSGLLLGAIMEMAGGITRALTPEDASEVVRSMILDASSRLVGPYAVSGHRAEGRVAIELGDQAARFIEESLRDAGKKGEQVTEEGGAILLVPKPGSKALMALAGKTLLGGGAESVRKALAAMAGKEPSLADDADRLRAIGATADGLLAVTDMDLKVVVGLAAGASILTPLLLRALPEDEEHAIARALAGALPRLLPAAVSLGFLDRFTAHARKDGPATVRGEGRVTFKK
jgi:hypothetical protein